MAIELSIIVPTLNEAPNLRPLVERLSAVAGENYEIIIVDDNSRDGTGDVVRDLSQQYPVKLVVREHPKDGLAGAVLQGFRAATGRVLVVIDADLQHPPEKVPELVHRLDSGSDFAIGSRYAAGGSTAERWGALRKINSRAATALARPFAGRVSDPMSGFFALRRETLDRAQRLTPLGYKIGLELMCKCRVQNVAEVPIHFGTRNAGHSKLTLREQFTYLEHLSRLYDFSFPRASPIAKFAVVTSLAWAIGAAGLVVLREMQVGPGWSVWLSYLGAIALTAIFHLRYVRTQREFLFTRHPWRDFVLSSICEWTACGVVTAWLTWRLDQPRTSEVFILGYCAAVVARYVLRKELLLDVRGLHAEPRVQR